MASDDPRDERGERGERDERDERAERDEKGQPHDGDAGRRDDEVREGPPWTDDAERGPDAPTPEPPPWL